MIKTVFSLAFAALMTLGAVADEEVTEVNLTNETGPRKIIPAELKDYERHPFYLAAGRVIVYNAVEVLPYHLMPIEDTETELDFYGVPGDGDLFVDFMESIGDIENPILAIPNNVGGSFMDAVKIALYIKEHKIDTVATGECVSACALIWMAGEELFVGNDADIQAHPPFHSNTGVVGPESAAVLGWLLGKLGYDSNVAYAIGFVRSPAVTHVSVKTMERWGRKVTRIDYDNQVVMD